MMKDTFTIKWENNEQSSILPDIRREIAESKK